MTGFMIDLDGTNHAVPPEVFRAYLQVKKDNADILGALKMALAGMRATFGGGHATDSEFEETRLVQRCRAAIAKAEGEL